MLLFVWENVLFVPNSIRPSIDPTATIRADVINWQTAVWIQMQQSVSADGKEYLESLQRSQ